MQLDRISYQRVFPIGNFATERIGLEASLDKDENPEEALNKLKVIVDTLHAETLTQLDLCRGSKVVDVVEPKDALSNFIEAITTCTTIKALESFKKLVEMQNVPELYEAYSETLKRLQNEIHNKTV